MTDFIALHKQLNRIESKIDLLKENEMALSDLLTNETALAQEVLADVRALGSKLDDEGNQIAALQQQVADLTAAGSGATPEQLAQLQSDLDALGQAHTEAQAHLPAPPVPFDGQNVDAETGFTWRVGDETFAASQERLFAFNSDAGANNAPQVAQPYPTETEWNALTAA